MTLEQLLVKLPEIRTSIAEILKDHRAQARPVPAHGFKRLPLFYPPELLRETLVVVVDKVPVPPLTRMGFREFEEFENGDLDGITYVRLTSSKWRLACRLRVAPWAR